MSSNRGPHQKPKSLSPPRCAPVVDWLRQEGHVDTLLPSAFRLIELEHALRRWLPASCRPAGLADGQLKILASSAAQASKLNQMAPSIVEGLARQGWQVTSVKVRVQGRSPDSGLGQNPSPIKQARMTADGLEAWRRLHATLQSSPLREAIERMIARHESY